MLRVLVVVMALCSGCGSAASPATTPVRAPTQSRAAAVSREAVPCGDAEVSVPRSTFGAWRRDPSLLLGAVRAVVIEREGKDTGLRLYGLDPKAPLAALGFTNGDTVYSVNQLPLMDERTIEDAYARLEHESVFVVELQRAGERRRHVIRVVHDPSVPRDATSDTAPAADCSSLSRQR